MLINILEGGGGSYLRMGAPLTFLERRGGSYSRSRCSLTFWRGEEGLT